PSTCHETAARHACATLVCSKRSAAQPPGPGVDSRPRQRETRQPGQLLGNRHQDQYWQVCAQRLLRRLLPHAIDRNGFHYLHIEPRHTASLISLPYYHRDPFDRLLIAQAQVEGIPLISIDPAFDPYPITRLW